MERCPSCQMEIRPGSRFCTQCGERLPEPVADDPAVTAEPWPGPPGSGLNLGWPLPEAVPTPLDETGPLDQVIAADPTDGPIWAEAPKQAETLSGPQVAAWPTPVAYDDQPLDPGPWVSPESAGALAEDAAWQPSGAPGSTGEAGDEPAGSDNARSQRAGEDDEPPAGPFIESVQIAILPETVQATEPIDTEVAGESPIGRAAILIEELRALLPRIAASPADLGVIAERLEAVANDESGRWPDLRTAMEDARANPRDVETVLGLSRRVDEVIALIDANDRLATTAREAAAAIRRGSADPA